MTTPSVAGTPQSFNFTATGTVLTYTGGGSTSNSIDVLCINSDTVVTVTGWTAAASRVNSQGSYIFTCDAGTASSATVTLSGGTFNTQAEWIRITDTSGLDTGGATATVGADGATGSSTPALTSGALASSTELALAFAALHSLGSPAPASYAWSSGYVAQANNASTTGVTGSQVAGAVAVKVPAGTAAETPSVSWTNATLDRYMLFVAFKETGGGSTVNADAPLAATATIASTAAVARPANSAAATTTTIASTAAVVRPANSAAATTTTIASTAAVVRPADSARATTATITATAGVVAAGSVNADSVRPITAGITATASVIRNANAALAVGVSIVATPDAPPAPAAHQGNWNSLLGIMRANEVQLEREITQRPTQCPNHLYPLDTDITGTYLHCTFGGEVFDLNGHPVYYLR